MLNTAPDLLQAFELHIRKPSFVVGLDRRYTENIMAEVGLPREEYRAVVAEHLADEVLADRMNLGSWVGPKEASSAEPYGGGERDDMAAGLSARAVLVSDLMRRAARHRDRPRWGFKILSDILHVDTYATVWPHAAFVLLVRDPRDHAVSVLKLNDQRQQRGQPNFFDDATAVAEEWSRVYTRAADLLADLENPSCIVRYEDLVSEPERTLAALAEAIGSDLSGWRSHADSEFVQEHAQRFLHHGNLTQPVQTASVERWRHELTPSDADQMVQVAGPVMERFGYR